MVTIGDIEEDDKEDAYIHNLSINRKQIQIMYKSPISKMIKPVAKSQLLITFQELKDSNQIENI